MTGDLTVIHEGRVAIVTINRPNQMNALNQSIFDRLFDLFIGDPIDPSKVDGIIITGGGDKAFVAGADIKEFLELDRNSAAALSMRGQKIFDAIESFPKPVIAAVNGFALGGGCELAMACHMRVAAEQAKFGLPEVNLGILPGYGGTQRLPQLVGKAKALEWTLTGSMVDAQEAHRWGLVNRLVPSENLLEVASKLIEKIAGKGPLAVGSVIQSINNFYRPTVDGYVEESNLFGQLAETQDFGEGVAAFVEKRKADFKGQ